MTIDWQKEVEARKDDLLKDLGDLIRINSIRDVEHGTKEEPLGPGPAAALRKVLEFWRSRWFRDEKYRKRSRPYRIR